MIRAIIGSLDKKVEKLCDGDKTFLYEGNQKWFNRFVISERGKVTIKKESNQGLTHSRLAIEMYSGYLMRVRTRSKLMVYSRNPRGCKMTWTSWCWIRTMRLFLTSLIGLRLLWLMTMSGLGPLLDKHFPTSPMIDPKCCERTVCKRLASIDMAWYTGRKVCPSCRWMSAPDAASCWMFLRQPSMSLNSTFSTGHSSSSITTCHHDPRFFPFKLFSPQSYSLDELDEFTWSFMWHLF